MSRLHVKTHEGVGIYRTERGTFVARIPGDRHEREKKSYETLILLINLALERHANRRL